MIVHEPENANAKNADGWFTPGRFAALLAGFIVATFTGVLLGQETFFYRDFGLFGYPLAHYQRECFWRGELPLWNPLNCCGLPFLAQWNTMTLYPPAIFYLLFPLSWSLGAFNLAHLWFAGVGMYFLAHRWTENRLAAAVAGTIFAFNGLTWHSLMWPNNIAALGWMPWVVLLVERAWSWSPESGMQHAESEALRTLDEGQPTGWKHSLFSGRIFQQNSFGRCLVLAVIAGAMQMLAGAPEIILLTWLFLAAMWLAQMIWGAIPKKIMATRFILIVALVAGLAAAQLLPFLELLSHSHRSAGLMEDSAWAMPLYGPANFLAPLFHCFKGSQGVFVQYNQYWVSSYFLGAAAVALAVAGVGFARKRQVWLLAGITLLCAWMALGNPGLIYPIAKKLMPALSLMRFPIKFIVLPVFLIPLLAAYGVSWHQAESSTGQSARALSVLRNVALALLAVMAVILWLAWRFPMVSDDWPATWRNTLGRVAFVMLMVAILTGANRAKQLRPQILLRVALIALLWADVYTSTANLSPTVRRSVYNEGLIRQELKLTPQAMPGDPRFMESQPLTEKMYSLSLPDPAANYLCCRLALYDDCNLLDDVSKLDGFYSLYLGETRNALSLIPSAEQIKLNANGLKDFVGVWRISAPDTDPAKSLDWLVRDTHLPLVTVGEQPIFADETNTARGLIATNFDSREIVYLPLEARGEVKADRAGAKILSKEVGRQRMVFQVESPVPAMAVIAQAFYFPWHAYVDGRRVKLWRANIGFQALEIPAGRHTVKVVYEDSAFIAGVIISSATLLLLAVAWRMSGRKHP